MAWKFRCSLCGQKFSQEQSANTHVGKHRLRGKDAHVETPKSINTDYSEAEYQLNSTYNL